MINSRQKGAAGERELAEFFRSKGYNARRGVQFSGGLDSPDIVVPALASAFHFESKRVQAGNPYNWMDQCIRDSRGSKIPVVAHRRNGKQWLAIMPLDKFIDLIQAAGYGPDNLQTPPGERDNVEASGNVQDPAPRRVGED